MKLVLDDAMGAAPKETATLDRPNGSEARPKQSRRDRIEEIARRNDEARGVSAHGAQVCDSKRVVIARAPPVLPLIPRNEIKKRLKTLNKMVANVVVDPEERRDLLRTIVNLATLYQRNVAAEKEMPLPARSKRRKALKALGAAVDGLDRALAAAQFISDQDGFEHLRAAVAAAQPWRDGDLRTMIAEKMGKGKERSCGRDWLIGWLAKEFEARSGVRVNVSYDSKRRTYRGEFLDLLAELIPNNTRATLAVEIQEWTCANASRQSPPPRAGRRRHPRA